MKKRIISMLLAGMMVLNSGIVYAEADMMGDYTAYADISDSEDEVAVQSETADGDELTGKTEVAVKESAESDEAEEAVFSDEFTDEDTDGQETVSDISVDESSQAESDEDAEIEITEDDIFSDGTSEQDDETAVEPVTSGTLASGVEWSLSEEGKLHFSGSGAIEKEADQDYPWDMTKVISIEIEKGITGIGSGAFASCTELKKISVSGDTLKTVSADAFENCSNAKVELYYAENAPAALPVFTGTANADMKVYYKEIDQTWTDAYKAAYTNVEWIPCCAVYSYSLSAKIDHSYVRDTGEIMVQTDGNDYPTPENMAYYEVTCSTCGKMDREYNDCIHCIDTEELQSDHPYSTETSSSDWTVSMKGAEEIILTFDERTKFETNYDDFFYIYDENGDLYQKYINDQLAGKTVIVPGSSVTLRLTTDYSTDEWGFAVTKAYGTTHDWDAGVITKPAERDQTGTMVKTCQKCGEVVEEVIPAPYIVCGEICGETGSVFWGITPDNVLELSSLAGYGMEVDTGWYGDKELNGHRVTNAPWGEYENYIEGLRIKKGITSIGEEAFYGLAKLKWAEIDDGVRGIAGRAFYGCTVLERINIPESTTTIGYSAFGETAITSINIPANLNYCNEYALGNKIREIHIEDLTQWLNMEEGPNLYSGSYTESKNIDYYVGDQLIENLVIPTEITRIRNCAFSHGQKIKTVTFHEKVEYIEKGAFADCINLEFTREKLPNYLKSIGEDAFANCKKISKVGIPSSVVNISAEAFYKCSGLTECIFAEDIQLEKIESSVFAYCENLKKIVIPSSVTMLGSYAFYDCHDLKEVEFLAEDKLTKIESYAFGNCSSLETISIPKSVNEIGNGGFCYCYNLKEVGFPKESRLKTIGEEVFRNCHELKNICIPAGVTSIGRYAFYGCSGDWINPQKLTFLGDFGAFESMFETEEWIQKTITYYACNSTWSSDAAQTFFSNNPGAKANPIHMSEDYTVISPATCTTDGEKAFICDNCGKSFTDVIPATGHDLTLKEHKDATCAEKGYDIQVCSNCNKEFTTELEIDSNAHQYDEGKVVEPNCSREGYTVYTCKICGSTKHEDYKPSTDHDYEITVVPATCQMQGYTEHQCKNCGYTYTDAWTEPLEHDYEETVTAPTCTERGYTYYSCKNCGYSYRDKYVGAPGHKYKKEVIAPTCVDEGYTRNTCSVCGLSYISNYREATGHDYKVVVTKPTCTERGYTTYSCKNCDHVAVADYRGVLGHSYEAEITDSTCTTKGFTTYTCVTCGNSYKGDETDLAPHKWDKGTITVQPTYQANGLKEFRCTDCGATYTKDIPALEQTDLSDCTVILSYRKTVYNGEEKKPEVTVKSSSGTVSKDDYTVTYADNVNAGEAKVIVTAGAADGSITGSAEIPFDIAKAKQNITAEIAVESIHVDTEEPVAVDGLGEISIVSEDEDIATVTEEKMILGKKKGTTYLKISAAGDDNHEAAETKVEVHVDENHALKITETVVSTCVKQGSITSVCEICGKTFVETKALDPVNGHDYEVKVTEPTCTDRGYKTYTCKNCKETKVVDYQEATGHTYKKEVKEPTCTKRGYTTYTCTKCDYVVTDDYREPLMHNYEKTVTPSSCTAEGFTTYTCTRCKESYVGDETDKTPHKWDKGTVTRQPNYLENGKKEFRCADCDATYTEDIPAFGQTSLEDCTVTLSYQQTVYNGREKTPKVTVKNDSGVISEENYTVAYADNTNAGKAKVTVTAKEGDVCVTGEVEKTFTISKAKQTVSAGSTDEQIHVKASTEIQVDGIGDVSLETDNNDLIDIDGMQITGKKAGLALIRVSVAGDENHEAGSSTVAVAVDEKHVTTQVIENRKTLDNGDVQYDEVQKCTLCDEELKRTTKTLKNLNSEECEIRLATSVYIFEGKAIKPAVSVTMAGTALKEGKDYSLKYKNNDRTGTATVAVTGIGNYINTKEATFQIVKLSTPKVTSIINVKKGMKLTWNRVSGAQGYIIYRAVGNGKYKAIRTISNAATLSCIDATATVNGGKYTYAVCAYKGSAKSAYVGKPAYYLAPNRVTSVKNNAAKKTTVKWTRNAKANGYQINYKIGNTQKTATIKSNKTLSTVLKSLKKKKTYSVKVRSYKKVSGVTYYSEWSPAKNVKINK